MEQIFDSEDTKEVVEMTRELLPASLVAATILASLTGIEPEYQSPQIVQLAGRISRDMAKTYLDGTAIHRSVCPDVPPYGERRSVADENTDIHSEG